MIPKYKKDFIDIPYMIAIKSQKLVGSDIVFDGQNENITNEISRWWDKNNGKEKLAQLIFQLSFSGRSIPYIVPTQDGNVSFKISNAYNMNRIGKVDEVAQIADIYDYNVVGDNCVIKQFIFTKDTIKIIEFEPTKDIQLNGNIAEIAKELIPLREYTIKNDLGRIPVFEFTNQIIPRYASNTAMRYFPDCLPVFPLVDQVQDIIQKKVNERALNHTRLLGTMSPKDFLDYNTNKDDGTITKEVENIMNMGYIANKAMSYSSAGQLSSTFEVSVGDPRFQEFNGDLDIQLKLIYNGAGYDWDGFDGNYTNKAESLQNNKNDLETTYYKRSVIKNGLYNLFDFVLTFKGLWDGQGERPYTFDFIDKTFTGQVKNVDMYERLLTMGVVPRYKAVKDIFGLNDFQAKKLIDETDDDKQALTEMVMENEQQEQVNKDEQDANQVNDKGEVL